MIQLNSPIKPNLKKLNEILEKINSSGWFTNFGPVQQELTARLEDYLGVKNLLLINNGTLALQVAAKAMGSNSILSTPFSFVATASAFKWQKTELSFSDIDSRTLNISLDAINNAYLSGCKADTIVATHVYGNPCDVVGMDKFSEKNDINIIYDAAHAFGVKVGTQSVLNYGNASTLSFHATKIFHTVEGGAIVFKDKVHLDKAKELINFGIRPGQGIVDIGINAKLNEYQAAVGLVNLDAMDNILEHRAELFRKYYEELNALVELPTWHPDSNYNGAYMPILLENARQMKKVSAHLSSHDIQSRHYFEPSLDQVFTDSHSYGSANSISASKRVLCLPMHSDLSLEDVTSVIKAIKEAV
ncbi:DegT/DnrJ/EryC1/StrS family aminotransferase [Vibrio cyclitrophicus]|uniref:DegT/DnrJ/EryC1/StrS family aminotransferase n=1 Tax=Vibrio cyclitrophicus TaxID=47951 RepID=UPI000C82B904|nr:DegT/DnrJ/EryC1/StrS family aminotransferase [Vibrio cyclitrophicus]PMF01975.1 aminotransferase DegT [Vibrio cyclitrophicus]PMO09156.1 aminotransferase DegT [Vibrio cyclitrophicus]